MIKVETIGMLDREVLNPVLTSESAVGNYSFITVNGELYLVANTLLGDDAYKDDYTFAAGEYLNGHLVRAWDGQKLVVDEKHIAYASGKSYDDIVAGTTLLKVASSGKLEVTASAPESGVYFKVTDKCTLTGKAVKMQVIVA